MRVARWAVFGVAAFAFGVSGCDDDAVVTPVNAVPSILLQTPNGGSAVAPGAMVEIKWIVTDDGANTVDLFYTAQGAAAPVAIASGLTTSSYMWTVPSSTLLGVKVRAVVTDDANQTAQDESNAFFAVLNASARGYVQSSVCQQCHAAKYTDVFNSGHPYKIQKVVGGQAPTFPSFVPVAPGPPTGYAWSDISYIIGGYGWKLRFMNLQGYVLTNGTSIGNTNVQYNLPRAELGAGLPGQWGSYEPTTTTPKPYTCGTCHATGWRTTAENGGVNQDGLPGILGTWEEPGISCERCHGAGARHAASQALADINVNQTKELCGSCHYRDVNNRIEASGTTIRHHEQYDEMISAGHRTRGCTDCHDPHIGTRYGKAAMGGIIRSCTSCHPAKVTNRHTAPADCEACHMARVSRTARSVHSFEHDIRTHIFKIRSDPVPRDSMFYDDAAAGKRFARGFVTLDYACYACHTDPVSGAGGGGSPKTLTQLSTMAKGIHN